MRCKRRSNVSFLKNPILLGGLLPIQSEYRALLTCTARGTKIPTSRF
jgi:hypothetical protein